METRKARFRALRVLGKGAMGRVYLVRDESSKQEFALKTIRNDLLDDLDTLQRFEREAEALIQIDHHAVVRTHGLLELGSVVFEIPMEMPPIRGGLGLMMDHVEGPTLRERLNDGPLELPEALRIFSQLAEGLVEIHRRGIIHRDLKPENLKRSRLDGYQLIDFGISKQLTRTALDTRGPIGTPDYIAPEQVEGEAEIRSDLFSFGVMTYESLSGAGSPFRRDTVMTTLAAVQGYHPMPLHERLSGSVPRELSHLVEQMMAKVPWERPKDAASVLASLREIAARPWPTAARAAALQRELWQTTETKRPMPPARLPTRERKARAGRR